MRLIAQTGPLGCDRARDDEGLDAERWRGLEPGEQEAVLDNVVDAPIVLHDVAQGGAHASALLLGGRGGGGGGGQANEGRRVIASSRAETAQVVDDAEVMPPPHVNLEVCLDLVGTVQGKRRGN